MWIAIKHSGILGMRWGLRRYQNADGTLTEAGKERYRNAIDKQARRDAKTFAKADLFYDEGKKILLKQSLSKKMTNKDYKNSFNKAYSKIDYIKLARNDQIKKNIAIATSFIGAIGGAAISSITSVKPDLVKSFVNKVLKLS